MKSHRFFNTIIGAALVAGSVAAYAGQGFVQVYDDELDEWSTVSLAESSHDSNVTRETAEFAMLEIESGSSASGRSYYNSRAIEATYLDQ
jgi:hypothetical protein